MAETQTAAQDTTQQVTSQIPTTGGKNPKRVATGKAIAEKRRLAREEQNKKIAEADAIRANERLRKAQERARKAEEVVAPPVEAPTTPPGSGSGGRITNFADHTMAERCQHNRFPGGHLLQTRGDKRGYGKDQGTR